MPAADPMALAKAFESITNDSKDLGAELKELKTGLIEFFEMHPDVERIGNVQCKRTPKKVGLSPKKMIEIVEEEVLREPTNSGEALVSNISTRVGAATEPGEIQLKVSLVAPKKAKTKN